jgi:phage gp36-like protein
MPENEQKPPAPQALACTPPSPSVFQQTLAEYGKTLTSLLSAAASKQTEKTKIVETSKDTVCAARLVSRYTNKVIKEYTQFNNCISMASTKDAEELVNTAKEITAMNDVLGKTFTKAVDAIKAAKEKIGQVKTLADKLRADTDNSCNSEEMKQIRAAISASSNKTPIVQTSTELVAYALKVTNSIDDVCESAVKVAGINAFINTQSLTSAATLIKTNADGFSMDIDGKLKSLQADYEKTKKDLVDAQKAVGAANILKYKAIAAKQGLDWVKKLIDNPECDKCGDDKKLDQLANDAAASFDESCS